MTATDAAARTALRARLGKGARYDAPDAPHDDLLLARRGTAYFARKLGELTDRDLDAPGLHKTLGRRQVIAHVSYHARGLACVLAAVRAGAAVPDAPTLAGQGDNIARGATLPDRALRHLFQHTDVHLNVEWRDLPSKSWDTPLPKGGQGGMTLRDTPRLRAHLVWSAALALGNGGRVSDIPAAIRDGIDPTLETCSR